MKYPLDNDERTVTPMSAQQFKEGEVIFREGTLGNTMYEIKSGTVGIYAAYGTSDEKKLTELEAGRIFGEMAVIEVYPRSATAVALSDAEAEEISAADLQEYFGDRPEKIMEIMRGMSRRLRELTADYREVCGTIGAWKDATDRGKAKGTGLLATLKRFAAIFDESMRLLPANDYMMYYHKFY